MICDITVEGEYFPKQSMNLFLFGRCIKSGIKSHNNPAHNPKQTGPNVIYDLDGDSS
jgi:hypothetical protein